MKEIFRTIKLRWRDFWYVWHGVRNPYFGNTRPQGWYKFNWRRLFDVLIVFFIFMMIIYVIFN